MSRRQYNRIRVKCPDCGWVANRTYDAYVAYGTCKHCESTKPMVQLPPAHSASRNAKIAKDFERFNR